MVKVRDQIDVGLKKLDRIWDRIGVPKEGKDERRASVLKHVQVKKVWAISLFSVYIRTSCPPK